VFLPAGFLFLRGAWGDPTLYVSCGAVRPGPSLPGRRPVRPAPSLARAFAALRSAAG